MYVSNIKHFPSSEWGPQGGTQAKIYWDGAFVGTYTDFGDGGPSRFEVEGKSGAEGRNFQKFLDDEIKNYFKNTPNAQKFMGLEAILDYADIDIVVSMWETLKDIKKQVTACPPNMKLVVFTTEYRCISMYATDSALAEKKFHRDHPKDKFKTFEFTSADQMLDYFNITKI